MDNDSNRSHTDSMTILAQRAVIAWFADHGRDLPWRHTRDPYAILVAEFMLQQTQVDRVVPKYLEFLQLFPTVQALADASTGDVIRSWRPLGYNRRAVSLQAIARQIMADFGGNIPSDVPELRRLKGIGAYTSGAIACFAFGKQVSFVDTNIRRVLGRIFPGQDAVSHGQAQDIASCTVPEGRSYDWHQALMDLGATVCTARSPQCEICPVKGVCRWRLDRTVTAVSNVLPRVSEERMQYDADPGPVLTLEHPAAMPRRAKASRPGPKFEGSARYYRGRIIASLCEAGQEGIPMSVLAHQLGFSLGEQDLLDIRSLVTALCSDGLVQTIEANSETVVRLPD